MNIYNALNGQLLDSTMFEISQTHSVNTVAITFNSGFTLHLHPSMRLKVSNLPAGYFKESRIVSAGDIEALEEWPYISPTHTLEVYKGMDTHSRMKWLKNIQEQSSHKTTFIREYELCECSCNPCFKDIEDIANSLGLVTKYMNVPKKNKWGRFLEERCDSLIWDRCPRLITGAQPMEAEGWLIECLNDEYRDTPIVVEGVSLVPVVCTSINVEEK